MARKLNRDARVNREGSIRAQRATKDRETTENRELSDDERVELLRMSYFQSALPDLPQQPGYHMCWLTTTNARDPIIGRERLGYELLRPEHLPGWEYAAAPKGSAYEGCIMVNEMVAARIPSRLYQRFMANNHHQEPLREEEKVAATSHAKQAEAMQYGAVLIESPGNVALGKDPGTPDFNQIPKSLPMSGDQTFEEADAAWVEE